MKKLYVLLAVMLVVALRCAAQTDTTVFAALPDGTPVSATSIDFKRACYDFSVSLDNQTLVARLRDEDKDGTLANKGTDILYDLTKNAVMWANPKSFTRSAVAFSFGAPYSVGYSFWLPSFSQDGIDITRYGALIRSSDGVEMLDMQTRNTKWEANLEVLIINDSLDIVLGYSSPTAQKLSAYRLSTGERLWRQKVKHEYNWGWDNVTVVNDHTLMVVADDINFIDMSTGNVIRYDAKTGYPDVGAILLQSLAGFAGGMIGGALSGLIFNGAPSLYLNYTPYIGNNIIGGITSNIVKVNSNFYVTDRDNLSCFNEYGDLAWSKPFPNKTMGAAEMIAHGDTLYIINRGYGLKGGYTMKKVGHPFIASYDANTGESNYIKYLSEGKNVIKGSSFSANAGFMIMDDSLTYNVLGDTTIIRGAWNEEADGKLAFMATDTIYTFRMNDTNLTPLYPTDDRCVVVTEKGKRKNKQRLMKVVNKDLNITDDYSADNVYLIEVTYKDYAIVAPDSEDKENGYWIIHKNGAPVAHITVPVKKIMVSGDSLFIISGTKFIQVDLPKLLGGMGSAA